MTRRRKKRKTIKVLPRSVVAIKTSRRKRKSWKRKTTAAVVEQVAKTRKRAILKLLLNLPESTRPSVDIAMSIPLASPPRLELSNEFTWRISCVIAN
jgi:hypothetical protein